MSLILLKEASQFPSVAKKYLKAICETNDELLVFLKQYKPYHKNIMIAIAEFRIFKLNERKYTLNNFVADFEINPQVAIQKLFLYPMDNSFVRYILKPLENEAFYLIDLYNIHKENFILNPILATKKLIHLTKLP